MNKFKKFSFLTAIYVFVLLFSFLALNNLFFIFLPSSLCGDVVYPDYSSFVNDYVGVLGFDWKDKTENICIDVESKTGAEIAVAVIDSLEGLSIEEYAVKLFEKWKIGKANKDNGVLLLVAIKDRKLRIEVGYGLEGAITDIEAGNIISDVITPFFKQEKYGEGVYNGVVSIAQEIYEEYEIESSIETTTIQTPKGFLSGLYEAFDVFNNGFCVFCCIPIFLFGFITSIIQYILKRKCPKCKKFALKIKQTVIQEPTYVSNGKMLEQRTCSNCGYSDEKIVKLYRKTKSRSGGFFAGGGFSGGSSGGGGFGGFGGGSSGGGGASGGW